MRSIELEFLGAAGFWLDGPSVFRRIWDILNRSLLGEDDLTVVRIVLGLLILIAAFVLSRRIGRFLERRIAQRVYIDPGLRYTIVRLASYALIVVGVLSALKMVGVDLTSVAVIFTALSVGIGFGLQYIAADIASGFILLFERPVRVGDRITIGEDEGDVKSIKLRTTIIFTNDRIAIIIPNSKLVSQRVINWSYGDPRARISIPISVATTSDVNLVTETLLVAAQEVENVLTDPPPKVQFLRFGDYSLDFRLLVWTRNPSRHPQIKSDINYRIEKLFRDRHIEIPYPTQEFLLKNVDDSLVRSALNHESRGSQDEDRAENSVPGQKLPRDS
ncbi:MAG TPA: mechanosensitive ion channel domain-containing protein [Pyrinomonadaceae bacterium]|nr:mechanosensitive ion channel domain-containing protein [Pyrinomonadaceae bacterium]